MPRSAPRWVRPRSGLPRELPVRTRVPPCNTGSEPRLQVRLVASAGACVDRQIAVPGPWPPKSPVNRCCSQTTLPQIGERTEQPRGYVATVSLRWYSVVVDCEDVAAQSRWWAAALGWKVVYEADDEVVIAPESALDPDSSIRSEQRGPGLVFVPVPEQKSLKNRLHIDLAPPVDADQESEVLRLEGLGAKRVDIGQDGARVTWVVMADPEGNEFCVLSPRD
jgi:catechol 2,3-dioxygenase-like lactoylglutathione lyase family enzyme